MKPSFLKALLFLILFVPCLLLAGDYGSCIKKDKFTEECINIAFDDPRVVLHTDSPIYTRSNPYNIYYPDSGFAAIVFIIPELDSCAAKVKILHVIQDYSNIYKNGDEFKTNYFCFNRPSYYISDYGWGTPDFYKPMYMLDYFENGKFNFRSLLDVDEYILAHKAIYALDRGGYGSGVVPTRFDALLPECSRELKLNCYVHRRMLMLHAFHTPYFNPLKASSHEADTLVQEVDKFFSYIGKNEKEKESFFRRLSQNREPIKIKPAQAKFIALGSITGMREFSKGDSSFCDIRIAPYFIFRDGEKREGKHGKDSFTLEANIEVYNYNFYRRQREGEIQSKKRGECFPAIEAFQLNYIFGSFDEKSKDSQLVIDSVASPWDFFYHGGNLVDLRMGLSYDEFLSYFMPKGLTFKDVYLNAIGEIEISKLELHALTLKQQKEIEAARKKVCEAKKNGVVVPITAPSECPQGEIK